MDGLQLVLIVGLVVMALINAASLLWALYLDRKLRGRPTPKHYDVHVEGTKVFPEVDMKTVEARAEELLTNVVTDAATKLQTSLAKSAETLASHIEDTTAKELEKYHINLEALSKQSIASFDKLQAEIASQRTTLLKQLDEELAKEKARRMDEFNAKLSDVVASYLMESLGTQVDLGAEAPYIFEVLTTHKEDIKRDVLS